MQMKEKPRPFATGFSLYKGLDTSIYRLFLIRIINRFGDFVQMLLVLILTGKLGLSSSQTGLFVSASIVATMIGQLASGFLAEHWKTKHLLVVCQSVVGLSYLACALVYQNNPSLIPFLILLSSPFRGGTAPLTNILVSAFSKPSQLSRSFSLLYLGTNIGVAVGPVAASFLYARSLVVLFLISSCLLLASTLMLIVSIPHSSSDHTADVQDFPKVKIHHFGVLWTFFVFFALYSLFYGQNTFTLPLQFSSLFGEDLGTRWYGTLMMVNAVTVLVATTFLTAWTNRMGQLSSMAVAMLFYVLGYGLYGFCDHIALFLVATVIWTLGEILMATNANVFVNAYSPPSLRSRSNAYITMFSSLGHALSPTLGGFLLLYTGYRQLWVLASIGCFLLGCGYIVLNKYLRT